MKQIVYGPEIDPYSLH